MAGQEQSAFETELQVRPDDIDMNRHVHVSRYMDYVLAARYDQMGRCYGVSMESFLEAGYGWVVRGAHLEYKRALVLGERFIVRTRVEEFHADGVRVRFGIFRARNRKVCCEGWFDYTMIRLATGRAERLPEWVVERYSI